jgi:FtsP/CotA-like multicopper oxidase with cupredoxin domain
MRHTPPISRRRFLRLGAGALAAAAGARLMPLKAEAQTVAPPPKYHLAGTDGWIALPATPGLPPYHPDTLAPSGLTTYMFGFTNVTGLTDAQVAARKNKCEAPAPLLWFDQDVLSTVKLSNLGLAQRPDLIDAHTIHWHGFRNALPIFDGEPFSTVSVPIGRSLIYAYTPRAPGTYMYHCHVEDTEHVHMGMTGVVYVRPRQNAGAPGIPAGRYAYNDGVPPSSPRSTAYDREYVMLLTEVWAEAHWDDAHVQLPEWTDYRVDFCLLNGRVYPDTIGGPRDPLTAPTSDRLRYQPLSSLVRANASERVLLRIVNLGYTLHAMTLAGIPMRVVGRDATLLRGADGADLSYVTNTISLGPGESVDAIFSAPAVASQQTYLLYDRKYAQLSNAGGPGYGGPMTEVRIFPAGTLGPQTEPNT